MKTVFRLVYWGNTRQTSISCRVLSDNHLAREARAVVRVCHDNDATATVELTGQVSLETLVGPFMAESLAVRADSEAKTVVVDAWRKHGAHQLL